VSGNLDKAFGFFRPFLESVVLPNKGLFAFFVGWGEFLVGIALIVGLATRWASIAGALMVAAFWFTKGQGFFNAMNHDSIWLMIFIVLATVHAGRAYSLDERLADRFRFLA
jgi:thiosulfate dehydrogenase [quinone] large subunit